MKYCSACGKQLTGEARFCDGCGAGASAPTAAAASSNPATSGAVPRGKAPKALVLGVAAVLLLGVAGGAYALMPKSMDPDEYADEVERIVSEMVDANEEWFDDTEDVFEPVMDSDYIEGQYVRELADVTRLTRGKLVKLRNELSELRPPEEYEDAHDDLVDASTYMAEEFWTAAVEECEANSDGIETAMIEGSVISVWSAEETEVREAAAEIAAACDEIGVDPFDNLEQLSELFSDDV